MRNSKSHDVCVNIANHDKSDGDENSEEAISLNITKQSEITDAIDTDPDDDEKEIAPPEGIPLSMYIKRRAIEDYITKHKKVIKWCFVIAGVTMYFVYFGFAMTYRSMSSKSSMSLLYITIIITVGGITTLIWKHVGDKMLRIMSPVLITLEKQRQIILGVILALIYIGVITFVLVDVFTITKQPYNLVSLGGLVCYVLLCFIFSYSPAHVTWSVVLWGTGLQFILSVATLRWSSGNEVFIWIGEAVSGFLSHSDYGSAFLFGDFFREHFIAFSVLPQVVFFSTCIHLLYYFGVMQVLVQKLGWLTQKILGTTPGESLNAAANIFVGMIGASLTIRPLIKDMTRSELHAVMTAGLATAGGSLLGAYISFGVPANHLISASVMSAPAALAIAKLLYPETQISKTTAGRVKKVESGREHNFIQAVSNGASQSISLVANIAVNFIAFLALLSLINALLGWFGEQVGWTDPRFSFELICSYLFYPAAVIMGVEIQDCLMVAELIGVKNVVNEFVAYEKLGALITNKKWLMQHVEHNGTFTSSGADIIMYNFTKPSTGEVFSNFTLSRGILKDRSEVLSVYALCGFANFTSMGIILTSLGTMAPNQKQKLSKVIVRAMVAGNVACFMTACISGVFYQRESPETEDRIYDIINSNTI